MKLSAKKIALLTTVAVVILLVFADEYPALRFRGDGKFSGGPVFGYEIRLRSIPFYRAGEYVFHFRGIPHEEMSLLLYTEGKKYLYAEYEGSPQDDHHELTHLQTAIEALLVDDRGGTVCQGTGFPLDGDLNGNPNGWILGGGDPAEYYHVNCLRVALKPSESYSLTIRIRDVDPQTPRINLTPVLQGGQLDLP